MKLLLFSLLMGWPSLSMAEEKAAGVPLQLPTMPAPLPSEKARPSVKFESTCQDQRSSKSLNSSDMGFDQCTTKTSLDQPDN